MAVFIAGLIGIVIFYLAILFVGIWASRKAKDNSEEEMMLAGRSLGFVIGSLTLIATWVGGGYISGASEVMYSQGLLWAQVPIGYSVSLLIGALLFVKPMRDMNCVTLLDPFQKKYGNRVGCFLFIPTIFGDIFWVASILNALGSALVVITGLSSLVSVIISGCFVAAYTSIGAMYSVTYTDVFQMFFLLFGLLISIPFVATSKYIEKGKLENVDWFGRIEAKDAGEWFDILMLLVFGGIPWQGYMQRILAIKSTKIAQSLSIFSTFGCAIMSIPSAYIGVAARAADWENVPTFGRNITMNEANIILPLVLRHLTPELIAFFGLGAISAAVMSSADSSVLAFSAIVSRNIYKNLFRQRASDKEIVWVLRITVLLVTILSSVLALTISSVYYLSVLSSDLIYVILFPQLFLVVYWTSHVNSYGCIASCFVGGILRILSGEIALGIPPVIKYPLYDYEKNVQKFPHRTTAMLCTLITHMIVSEITNKLFQKNLIPAKMDVLGYFKRESETQHDITLGSTSNQEMGEMTFSESSQPQAKLKLQEENKEENFQKSEKSTPFTESIETQLIESFQCKNEEIHNFKINDDFTVNHRLRSFNRGNS